MGEPHESNQTPHYYGNISSHGNNYLAIRILASSLLPEGPHSSLDCIPHAGYYEILMLKALVCLLLFKASFLFLFRLEETSL